MAVTPQTEAANLMINRYNPGLLLAANEEMKFADKFSMPDDTQYINGRLFFRKIARHTAQTLGAGGTGAGLTYNSNTEDAVSATPTFIYSGVQIPLHTLTRVRGDLDNIEATGKLMAAYKKQSMAALATQIDSTSAQLAASLTTNIVGSGAVDLSKGLLLAAIQKLLTNGRDKMKPGQLSACLCIHPSQASFLLDIAEVTAANLRGDKENPLVKGWAWNTYGLEVRESGNTYQTGGETHNMVWVEEAFAIGYNQRPRMLPLQDIEAYYNLITVAEHGEVELFDEYAVDIVTRG